MSDYLTPLARVFSTAPVVVDRIDRVPTSRRASFNRSNRFAVDAMAFGRGASSHLGERDRRRIAAFLPARLWVLSIGGPIRCAVAVVDCAGCALSKRRRATQRSERRETTFGSDRRRACDR